MSFNGLIIMDATICLLMVENWNNVVLVMDGFGVGVGTLRFL